MRPNQKPRLSPSTTAILVILVTVAATYLAFTREIPFRHHYTVNAVFHTANNIRPNSPVRIAGVNVGKVTKVEHLSGGREAAVVSMRIDKKGLPIHKDAVMLIRPRIFLEGNFFVDIRPGSPSSPTIGDGDTIPINQTKTPVQLDQILTALQSDTRDDLKLLLNELSTGLSGQGGKGYNRSIKYWEPAYRDSAIVADAQRGILEHDLSNYIKNAGATADALDRFPQQLKSLITDFNTTAHAFAIEDQPLEQAIKELPRTLQAGMPALQALNRSFPPLRRFIKDFRPGVRSSGPALDASLPFVRQLRGLVQPSELRGLSSDLRPTVPALARLNEASIPLYEQTRLASSCQNEVILPWTKDTIQDKTFPATGNVYQESTKPLVGLAGESRSGDANGQWFRVLLGSGNFAYPLQQDKLFLTTAPLIGTNPPKPPKRTPLRSDVPCETQQGPDLRTVPGTVPQPTKAQIPADRLDDYNKLVEAAVTDVRKSIDTEGLKGKLSVTDKPVTESALGAIRRSK
ncbi:MAG: phospholipid/cholesterol/gamma-HCH transport system substrate-binding protein [Gaiellales bacterium]|nr:phospholipid/cholesterol/gamma-HCH transport system substrate-binding protein [Gaiellales bacterium]